MAGLLCCGSPIVGSVGLAEEKLKVGSVHGTGIPSVHGSRNGPPVSGSECPSHGCFAVP
jgi:hypothetical protein